MREVFLNLILNAVQSLKGQGEIQVVMKASEADQTLEIQIYDNGEGISAETIDKLFNPFFSTRHDALGLGLFVTKQIVHRYGGSIRVESRVGEGSLFTVRLPYGEFGKDASGEPKASLSASPAVDSLS
jgi:signal transduction histidine kinase